MGVGGVGGFGCDDGMMSGFCDVGCWMGVWGWVLRDKGCNVHGVDCGDVGFGFVRSDGFHRS